MNDADGVQKNGGLLHFLRHWFGFAPRVVVSEWDERDLHIGVRCTICGRWAWEERIVPAWTSESEVHVRSYPRVEALNESLASPAS